MRVEEEQRNVHTVRIDYRRAENWEAWVLLTSDRHHDNQHADHSLEERHLKQAKERGALVLDFGDLFCAMQGKWDKRADQNQLREELRGNDYLDRLVTYNSDFYRPYAEQLTLLGLGNHETSVLRNHQTNLSERIAQRLRDLTGHPVYVGAYRGWVRFLFSHYNSGRQQIRLRYTHGSGGVAPVTKGVISTNRHQASIADADIVVSGHNHNQWLVPLVKEGLNDVGRPTYRKCYHLKIPGYKRAKDCDGSGWEQERDFMPTPLGAWWIRFYWDSLERRVGIDPQMAQ